jgi:hypothetical protein
MNSGFERHKERGIGRAASDVGHTSYVQQMAWWRHGKNWLY